MNKKLILALTFLLCFGLMAAGTEVSADFEEYKIVGSIGDTIEQTVFDLDDPSPYLYMKLPALGQAFTGSFWRDPEAEHFYETSSGGADLERWVNLSNWDTVKKAGEWEVTSNYFYTNGNTGFASTNFTVTPEPLAMTLFLIGGAPIGISLYRKRKRTVTV